MPLLNVKLCEGGAFSLSPTVYPGGSGFKSRSVGELSVVVSFTPSRQRHHSSFLTHISQLIFINSVPTC
jgi:hypothetical protein